MILMLSFQYEVLLDKRLIFYYKNGLLEGKTSIGLLNAVLLTPIWEEMFFRGVLLFTLLKFTKPVLAISLSGVVFALFHPMYWIVTLASGVLLSLTAYKTKSLIPSFISHSLWNLYSAKFFLYF
ncbi:CPBP family intramembrane metalloprotease [Bacillus sp. ISL-39]|nr:CPBP family intramembrane metalloprotease [Bacillus sp. ISL-39]